MMVNFKRMESNQQKALKFYLMSRISAKNNRGSGCAFTVLCKKILPTYVIMYRQPFIPSQRRIIMKKSIVILIAALLLAICPAAFAQEELPQELLILYAESNGTTEYSDTISFDMPDGTQVWHIINDWGFMEGYRFSDGEWNRTSSGSPTASSMYEPYFVCHDTTTMRVDGSFYSDSLGYDLQWNKSGERISLHYNGEAFVLCGWENAAAASRKLLTPWANDLPMGRIMTICPIHPRMRAGFQK